MRERKRKRECVCVCACQVHARKKCVFLCSTFVCSACAYVHSHEHMGEVRNKGVCVCVKRELSVSSPSVWLCLRATQSMSTSSTWDDGARLEKRMLVCIRDPESV